MTAGEEIGNPPNHGGEQEVILTLATKGIVSLRGGLVSLRKPIHQDSGT